MAFLSGLLGSLGGPGNIIKSVGEFVSDSLGNLAKGKGFSGIAEAGSKAVKTLVGLPNEEYLENRQVSNMRPMMITNDKIPNNAYPGRSLADMRPIISTKGNKVNNMEEDELPRSVFENNNKMNKSNDVIEYRKTTGGFPETKYIKNPRFTKISDIVEPGITLNKAQKKRLKNKIRREKKKFKNYMG